MTPRQREGNPARRANGTAPAIAAGIIIVYFLDAFKLSFLLSLFVGVAAGLVADFMIRHFRGKSG
jgi:hypothetical protein